MADPKVRRQRHVDLACATVLAAIIALTLWPGWANPQPVTVAQDGQTCVAPEPR